MYIHTYVHVCTYRALRLHAREIWPQVGAGWFGATAEAEAGGGAAAGATPHAGAGQRAPTHAAELVEHLERLRHGLPDREGWAELAALAGRARTSASRPAPKGAGTPWSTPRRDDARPRDGRLRATQSHRRGATFDIRSY